MEYWVAEVKAGEVYEVDIPVGKALHLSHACLGQAQKGPSHIHLFVYADGTTKEKNVLGSLNPKKLRNLSFNLSFSKSFRLSHSSKNAVYFHGGFMAANPTNLLDNGEIAPKGFINKDEISKKRGLESISGTIDHDKKRKVATPQNDDGMNDSVLVDVSFPSKQNEKTHAKSLNQKTLRRRGSHPCKQCTRTFGSEISVELHTKAKHA